MVRRKMNAEVCAKQGLLLSTPGSSGRWILHTRSGWRENLDLRQPWAHGGGGAACSADLSRKHPIPDPSTICHKSRQGFMKNLLHLS